MFGTGRDLKGSLAVCIQPKIETPTLNSRSRAHDVPIILARDHGLAVPA